MPLPFLRRPPNAISNLPNLANLYIPNNSRNKNRRYNHPRPYNGHQSANRRTNRSHNQLHNK